MFFTRVLIPFVIGESENDVREYVSRVFTDTASNGVIPIVSAVAPMLWEGQQSPSDKFKDSWHVTALVINPPDMSQDELHNQINETIWKIKRERSALGFDRIGRRGSQFPYDSVSFQQHYLDDDARRGSPHAVVHNLTSALTLIEAAIEGMTARNEPYDAETQQWIDLSLRSLRKLFAPAE